MRNASNDLLNLLPLIVLIAVILATGCTSTATMRLTSQVNPRVAVPEGKKVAVGPKTVWIDADLLTHVSADSLAKLTRRGFDGQVWYSGIWDHYDVFSEELMRQLDSVGFIVVDSAGDADMIFALRGSGHRGGGGIPVKFPRDMNNIDHRYVMKTGEASLVIEAYLPHTDTDTVQTNPAQRPRRQTVWLVDLLGPSGAIVEERFPSLIRTMLSAYGKKVRVSIPVRVLPEPKRKSN